MPRLKERPKPFAEVRRLLLGYEMDGPKMARAMDRCETTGKRRLDHPEELTLGELGRICRNTGIPADEIRAAIKFQ